MNRVEAKGRFYHIFTGVSKVALSAALLTARPTQASEYPVQNLGFEESVVGETEHALAILEQTYNIEIYNAQNVSAAESPLNTRWDEERLLMLERHLSYLPEHFWSPREDGSKVRFVLMTNPMLDGQCVCRPYTDENGIDTVHLNFIKYNPDRDNESFELITHELLHRVTPIERVISPTTQRPIFDSAWFDRINEILGGDFYHRRNDIFAEIQTARPRIREELLQMYRDGLSLSEEDDFIADFLYGIGKLSLLSEWMQDYRHPNEFIGVLGQKYIWGKEYFKRMYGLIFDSPTVDELYSFVKDEIFQTHEYPDG